MFSIIHLILFLWSIVSSIVALFKKDETALEVFVPCIFWFFIGFSGIIYDGEFYVILTEGF